MTYTITPSTDTHGPWFGRIKEPEEILDLYNRRVLYYGKDLNRMRMQQRLMNNEMDVPLPELGKDEQSLIANFALKGLDQLSQRIASVEPSMHWPSTRPGSDAADLRATNRRRVMQGWHEENDMYFLRSKRARHFLSWACSPVVIKPDPKTRRPKWEVRSPLETFLPPASYDEILPLDIITCDVYSYQQLLQLFDHDSIGQVTKPPNWNWDNDVANYNIQFEVLEYIDENEISLILAGHSVDPSAYRRGHPELRGAVRLSYAPNLTGRPLVVCPGRICLDAQLGHFDGIIGMYQARAAMTAMMVIAQRKSIWPTPWIESHPQSQEEPEILQDPDPYKGVPGIIANGRFAQQNLDPSFRALEIIDRMSESERQDAGITGEMLGSQRTHISGRRGAQVMGATIDFTIGEAQQRFARSLKEEDKIAIAIDKAFFPTKKTFYIESRGFTGGITYTPEDLWEIDSHIVEYPLAGSDLQSLPIEGGQRVQMESMSVETFMELDPMIKDKEAELQRTDREAIKRAFKSMVQTMAANPDPNAGIQPVHLALLDKYMEEGTPLLRAFIRVDEMVKKEQQAAAEAQAAQQPPTEEMQPGTSTPGAAGTPQAMSSIPEPPQSLARFTQLLGSLGTTQQAQKYRS